MTTLFRFDRLTSGYGGDPVIKDLDGYINEGEITCLIGPNGCGKSTLLKTMCGLLPYEGTVEFGGRELTNWGRKERAREMSLLPQSPTAPAGLTVRELIARGRHPYQSWLTQWSDRDDSVAAEAIHTTGVAGIVDKRLNELSGGQRQRAWIAMAIAQDTPTMLLDEPTTFLDLATSVEVLRLVQSLNRTQGRSVVMVLHDLNLAARFSDRLIMLNRHGTIAATGTPGEVLHSETLKEVFDLDAVVVDSPVNNHPLVVPR
ncbi:ABC transporter ATP-binding protein [Corynebacterium cystitidis]|uniref:Iron complex transport system ATP-binding protein n=1 Tax=Corynebacterium cystitidis DSM 20524 TaxID=1121357 RepID=A0A1H9VT69_9CORY|nr:ABC transporter ATP-binding protein [Corynebacterium cystitidis]WJY81091.1 putative siderophore transport system ATP-binding protein YusV [Corynebacterium cystitidis DSM 20524]SES24926.1 iron complex transport system ATP-binding protein [Corynebacterium cystitidis DSM 20524]SNV90043.1 iron complex ABC transporter ATP-binding protein [Corynebacterium cystitidis]